MTTQPPLTTAEARRLWVEALRSGEYKQGDGRLKYDNKLCVLGIACDLYAKNTGQGRWEDDSFYVSSDDYGYEGCVPSEVMDWLGLRDEDGGTYDGEALYELNDDGVSFPELADIIESNPPGLFVEEPT